MTPPELPGLFRDELQGSTAAIGPQAVLLRGLACNHASDILADLAIITGTSPFRNMTTPGGREMSVSMTNCGEFGWITDRGGYGYGAIDPITGNPWPAMPPSFVALAAEVAVAAGFRDFRPDACLINRYAPSSRLSLHQDRNETDFAYPIVSVSLGLPAIFLWGGNKRSDSVQRIPLLHGDVVVWGGPDRLRFHGVSPLADGHHMATGDRRYNLTFRRAH